MSSAGRNTVKHKTLNIVPRETMRHDERHEHTDTTNDHRHHSQRPHTTQPQGTRPHRHTQPPTTRPQPHGHPHTHTPTATTRRHTPTHTAIAHRHTHATHRHTPQGYHPQGYTHTDTMPPYTDTTGAHHTRTYPTGICTMVTSIAHYMIALGSFRYVSFSLRT